MTSFDLITLIKEKTGYTFLESQLIFNKLLNVSYERDPHRKLTESEVFLIKDFLSHDSEMPIEYILGYKKFGNAIIHVTRDTLIPRNETEELTYRIISENLGRSDLKILDLCTGSGAIAIALALGLPSAKLYASDLSEAALAVAEQNAQANQVKISFLHGDYLSPWVKEGLKFDIVVSNPPYVAYQDPVGSSTTYEPSSAIFCAEEGLESYKKILSDLPKIVKKGSLIYFEISSLHVNNIISLIEKNLKNIHYEILRDSFDNYRFVKICF